MNAKQKKIRVFDIDIENENKFFEFMEKNFVLVKDYLLLLNGKVTENIIEYLEKNSICFVDATECNIKKIDNREKELQIEQTQLKEQKTQVIVQEKLIYQEAQPALQTKVIKKPVRSGEIVQSDGDIVIFSRVNSGAKVLGEANVSIYDTIDGIVEAYGDFLILKDIGKGYVVFNGDILEKDDFTGKLKKVSRTSQGYEVEEL